jgi:hypothetical protein
VQKEKDMTVAELIEQLKNYPADMRVLTLGYESGFNDINLSTEDIVFNFNNKDTWYYGPHECVRFAEGDKGEKCVIVGRGK